MISRSRIASATAWVRVSASSLRIAFRTWVRTVSGDRNRRAAISLLGTPSASMERIWRSRSESPASWPAAGLRSRSPLRDGSTNAPPPATVRTARTTSSGVASLITNPRAPHSRPRVRSWRSPNAVNSSTAIDGSDARISRVASNPASEWSNGRSMITTSGLRRPAMATAASGVPVSPTTPMSGSEVRIAFSPARVATWSSTIRTLMAGAGTGVSSHADRNRSRSVCVIPLDLPGQLRTDLPCHLAHPGFGDAEHARRLPRRAPLDEHHADDQPLAIVQLLQRLADDDGALLGERRLLRRAAARPDRVDDLDAALLAVVHDGVQRSHVGLVDISDERLDLVGRQIQARCDLRGRRRPAEPQRQQAARLLDLALPASHAARRPVGLAQLVDHAARHARPGVLLERGAQLRLEPVDRLHQQQQAGGDQIVQRHVVGGAADLPHRQVLHHRRVGEHEAVTRRHVSLLAPPPPQLLGRLGGKPDLALHGASFDITDITSWCAEHRPPRHGADILDPGQPRLGEMRRRAYRKSQMRPPRSEMIDATAPCGLSDRQASSARIGEGRYREYRPTEDAAMRRPTCRSPNTVGNHSESGGQTCGVVESIISARRQPARPRVRLRPLVAAREA